MICNIHAAFIAVLHGPALSSTGGYERKKRSLIGHFKRDLMFYISQTLEEEISRLKGKIEKLQNELSHRKKTAEEKETKHREEMTKLSNENRQNSRRMRDLMVEVTQLQAKEPEVCVTLICMRSLAQW